MRLVSSATELEETFTTASVEALAAFGDGRIYVERALVPARHVEVQVLADSEGNVLTLGERECSIQRRHQKLVEESPSPALTPEQRDAMEEAAERACRAVGYLNAGTFEFLVGPDGSFYFIELNARLQVEHPVTELVTGLDLVREQVRIAAGEPLTLTGRAPRGGHAIEVRINAEDPAANFAPSPGRVTRFRPPLGPFDRLDTHVEEGTEVSPHYDSLLAKLIVWDLDRPAAIARCRRALSELVIEGVRTTRELAIDIMQSEAFTAGSYSTSFLDEAEDLPALRASEGAGSHAARPDHRRAEGGGAASARCGRERRWREDRTGSIELEEDRVAAVTVTATRGAVLPSWPRSSSSASPRRSIRPWHSPAGRRDVEGVYGESVMAGRRAARRTALFLLYQWDLTGQPLASLYEGDIDEFSRELAEAVSGEAAELDRMIDEASDEWRADRLGVLERNVMRIGIYELVHGTVPVEVAISEAVNLAKRYASDEAGKLVNGVLARVARERVV